MEIKIDSKGLDNAIDVMQQLSAKAAFKAQTSALRKSSKFLRDALERATPVDSGDLSTSWRVKKVKLDRLKYNIIFDIKSDDNFYFKFLEYGAVNHITGKEMTKHKGFASRALATNMDESFRLFKTILFKRVKAAFKRKVKNAR